MNPTIPPVRGIEIGDCAGCVDDFYNGNNDLGVKQCWGVKTATMVERVLIHIDQAPPYRNLKPRLMPSCYKKKRHVTVKLESIGPDGYWR